MPSGLARRLVILRSQPSQFWCSDPARRLSELSMTRSSHRGAVHARRLPVRVGGPRLLACATGPRWPLAAGMTVIAVPLGTVLAFIMVRTDVPGRAVHRDAAARADLHIGGRACLRLSWLPGRSASSRLGWKDVIGVVPLGHLLAAALIVIAGLTHVPHVYLYTGRRLRGIGSDVEEAARIAGASPFRVALACQPADGPAVDRIRQRAGFLPWLRALWSAARAGRSAAAPRPHHLSLQADQHIGHAAIS